MTDLRKRIAYLQGLMEGYNLDGSTKEGRLFKEFAELMDQMAEELFELKANQTELEDYVESVDEDLLELEDEVYEQVADDESEEEDWVEVDCPNCGETVCFEPDILDDDENVIEVTCPNCEAVVFVNNEDYEFEEAEEFDRVVPLAKSSDDDI